MGKKRRMLSSKRKFGTKHSSHPRMRHIMKTEETESAVVTTTITEPEVVTPIIATTPPEIKTTPPVLENAVTPAITLKSTETTTVVEKTAAAPIIKKATPIKKKAPAKKTRKSTTKSKTISRNA
jgi:hypothetical protein